MMNHVLGPVGPGPEFIPAVSNELSEIKCKESSELS